MFTLPVSPSLHGRGTRPRTPASEEEVHHRELARWNRQRLVASVAPPRPERTTTGQMLRAEIDFVHRERRAVAGWAAEAPRTGAAFLQWFEGLNGSGPGQHDPLLAWLSSWAPRSSVLWFVREEAMAEGAFSDLAVIPGVHLPPLVGTETGTGYRELANALGVDVTIAGATWEALAFANLTAAMATDPHLAWQAVGALAASKLTAHAQAVYLSEALQRIDVDSVPGVFARHASHDQKRSPPWSAEYLDSIFVEDPSGARSFAVAEGALMRLAAQARCYARYRQDLGLRV